MSIPNSNAVHEPNTISLAFGTSKNDPHLTQENLTPAEFVERFAKHREGKKDGEYFVAARFGTPYRNGGNIEHYTGCPVDVDRDIDPQEIREKLDGLAYVAHETYKPGRARVCLPYSRPISLEQHKTVAAHFNALFGDVDPCNEKTCQFFYTPACPPGEDRWSFTTMETGERLDPLSVPGVASVRVPDAQPDAFENHVAPRDMTDDEYEALLNKVDPNDLDYDGWTVAGMATHHQTQGRGLPIFLAWSSRSWKHDEATTRRKWPSFNAATYGGKPVTVGSIEHMVLAAQSAAAIAIHPVAEDVPQIELDPKDPEGNAARIHKAGNLVRHRKQSFVYQGTHWQPLSDEEAEAHLNEMLRGKGFTPVQKSHTFAEAQRLAVVREFKPDPARLAFRNGVLNLAGWDHGGHALTLEPHAPEHHITSLLPFDFDPGASCDRWRRFLDQVLPDKSFQALLQEFMGYCLVWDYRHQKMLLMHGASRSGKGTIARAIEKLIGPGGSAGISLSSLAADRGLVILANAKVGIVGDAHRVEKNKIERAKEALLTVTGQDSVQFDPKYKDAYSGKVPARLILIANEMPRFFDNYNALANRYLVLEFKESFAGREDVELDAALEAELPGILNWALEGLDRLGARNAFTDSDTLRAARMLAAERNNPRGGFLARYVQRVEGGRLFTDPAYAEYRRYCAAFDHRPETQTAFGKALSEYLTDLPKKRTRGIGEGLSTAIWGAELNQDALAQDLGEYDFDVTE